MKPETHAPGSRCAILGDAAGARWFCIYITMDDVRHENHLKHRSKVNRRVVEVFWLAICAIVLVICARRTSRWWRRCYGPKASRKRLTWLRTWLDRKTAIFDGIAQLALPFAHVSLGRFIALATYTVVVVALLLSVDAPTFTSHFTDDVAFRAAWTTLSQIPLVYLLSTKRGPLNYLTGISYERINWAHRCVGRLIFVSATTHMAIMLSSLPISSIFRSSEKPMRMIRYGAGSYILLVWISVSSMLEVRKRWYRTFYINHWISTLTFLGLVGRHVPSYARLPVYVSLAVVAVDKSLVMSAYLWNNVTLTPVRRKFGGRGRDTKDGKEVHVLGMGHPVKMVLTPGVRGGIEGRKESTTVIRIADVPFRWKPGQHVRIWLPKLGPLEVHPFTPATCSILPDDELSEDQDAEDYGLLPARSKTEANDMTLLIKAHHGLTKRLAEYRDKWRSLPCPNASRPSSSLVAFMDGPYGSAPAWEEYENIVLLATSTGVSFILSIVHYLEQLCVMGVPEARTQHISFVWANRHVEPQFEAAVTDLLLENSSILREAGVSVEAKFYVTCPESSEETNGLEITSVNPFAHVRRPAPRRLAGRPPLRIRNPNDPADWESDDESAHAFQNSSEAPSESESCFSEDTYVKEHLDEQRPCLSELEPLEEELQSSCWSRFKLSRGTGAAEELPQTCRCAILRDWERNCKARRSPRFITRCYGMRPDVGEIIGSAVPRTSLVRTMIAVCGGSSLGVVARAAVSRMNLDFAIARRERGVDLHAEDPQKTIEVIYRLGTRNSSDIGDDHAALQTHAGNSTSTPQTHHGISRDQRSALELLNQNNDCLSTLLRRYTFKTTGVYRESYELYEKELDASTRAYSRASSRALVDAVYAKLPQELTDIIYQNLLDWISDRHFRLHLELPKNLLRFENTKKPPAFAFITPRLDKLRLQRFPHEDFAIMGTPFVRELLEMYFREVTFVLRQRSRDCPPLATFLHQEPFREIERIMENFRPLEDTLSSIKRRCRVQLNWCIGNTAYFGPMEWKVKCLGLRPMAETLDRNGCIVASQATLYHEAIYDAVWMMENPAGSFIEYLDEKIERYCTTTTNRHTQRAVAQEFAQKFAQNFESYE
ncbi:hypothetical protein BU23DRAFT_598607 [Bimuria novae-zelandiae CBS 107.79]|uniref:FAD-binding FR-type domain-containing protein n=1 Tax=Bimuria novae-zelandiae CBS 107.79 TaxID=1447943 RepID=A0A6A5VA39_9PLEO|nr:hypothetical protein BU23DRAFT_598607 [Bimuria novae-zelandiae CBS 107.79]